MRSIIKLKSEHFQLALEHLYRLSPEDRRFRFNGHTSDIQLLNYSKLWLRDGNHFYGILEDSKIIAFMHIAKDTECENAWEIGLSVDADKQGLGIGSQLLNFGKELVKMHNWSMLTFRYAEANRKLFALCRKTGFSTVRDGAEYLSYYDTRDMSLSVDCCI